MTDGAWVVAGKATPMGRYPHVKVSGRLAFVSGTSSRRADGTIAGAEVGADGAMSLDIRAQTSAVIENLGDILGEVGAELGDLVSVTAYLVDMGHFEGYNEVYGAFFDEQGPARTTIAVGALPHPHLLIEMQAIAALPGAATSTPRRKESGST